MSYVGEPGQENRLARNHPKPPGSRRGDREGGRLVGKVLHDYRSVNPCIPGCRWHTGAEELLATILSALPLKIYLVEDSLVIRESLIATLEELVPVTIVGTAEDERTAVQWLSQPTNPWDLVVIDIFLKHGSGLGVLRFAQTLSRGRALVVLSNYATIDMQRKCLELGADRVFDKSNDIEDLIQYCGDLAAGGTLSPTNTLH